MKNHARLDWAGVLIMPDRLGLILVLNQITVGNLTVLNLKLTDKKNFYTLENVNKRHIFSHLIICMFVISLYMFINIIFCGENQYGTDVLDTNFIKQRLGLKRVPPQTKKMMETAGERKLRLENLTPKFRPKLNMSANYTRIAN